MVKDESDSVLLLSILSLSASDSSSAVIEHVQYPLSGARVPSHHLDRDEYRAQFACKS